jgi:hypothetical protein
VPAIDSPSLADRHSGPVDQIRQGDQDFDSVFAFFVPNAVDGRKVGRVRLIEDTVVDIPCFAVDQTPGELLTAQDAFLAIRVMPVEVKACESIHPIHKAQLLSYMKLLDIPLGLIINFNELKLADGISRLILPGANRE